MTIELNPETEALVTNLVSRGRYGSVEQAASAAFALLEEKLDGDQNTNEVNAMSIVELFANSPFAKYDITLEQEREPWTPIDL